MKEILVVHARDRRSSDIYIGRPSPLGNPYRIGPDGDRKTVIDKYRTWLRTQSVASHTVRLALDNLRFLVKQQSGGPVRLVCYCAPLPCHGDVIREHLMESLGLVPHNK